MDTVKMNPPMPDPNHCPQCGTPLPFGALAGLCPACLLKMGAAADTVTDAKQKAFVPPDIAELAAKFPQLEILELVGKGGMGAVYKARQKQLDRVVALKILPPGIGDERAFAERFAREAKALAKLNHPNIVTLYEFGDAGGQFYFLMEFVDGVNLRQLLAGSRIAPREALAIVPQICDALQFAHDQGIVHRDIKPENILIDRRGRVKVADFGLAKIIEPGRADLPVSQNSNAAPQCPTGVMGTPQYMSPEQITAPGEVDHRADIYALGVVFYQMLTGELPDKKIAPPSTKVHIDVRLDQIVLRALEKKPELRYQQVSEVKTCVETIVGTPGGNEKTESENQKTEPGDDVDLISHWFKKLGWKAIMILIIALSFMGVNNQVSDFFFGAAIVAYLAWSWLGIRYTKIDGWKFESEKSDESKSSMGGAPFESKWWAEFFRRFTASPISSSGSRFSRTAIAGAIWSVLAVVVLANFTVGTPDHSVRLDMATPLAMKIFFQLVVVLGITAPLGVTILGWVAVAQIRRSAGKIYGLRLAVFDGLLFPLLELDGLIWFVCNISLHQLDPQYSFGAGRLHFAAYSLAVAVIISVLIDGVIVQWVWRAVKNRGANIPSATSPRKSSTGKIIAIGCGTMVLGLFLIAVITAALFLLNKPKIQTMPPPQILISGHPLFPGVVASWPAEGNANSTINTSAGSGTLSPSGVVFAPGKVGMGFWLDGTNGFVEIPDSPALKPKNVTVEAWVWLDPDTPADHGGEVIIFKKNTWSAWFEGYCLVKDHVDNADGTFTDRFCFVVSNHGKQVILHSATPAQRGVWYHVAGTYDGYQSTLWVNGVAEDTATPGFALDYDTTPVYIGTSHTWTPYLGMFAGIINQPTIYNRALSAEEIKQIFDAGNSETEQITGFNTNSPNMKRRFKPLGNGYGEKYTAMLAVQNWLALADTGAYSQTWDTAADSFRADGQKDAWVKLLEKVRQPLGSVISRQLISTHSSAALPGMPDGSYFIAQFETSFAALPGAVETVEFMQEKDGQWRAIYYLIRPRTAEQTAAVAAAQKWLAGIDAGNYAASWTDSSEYFQGAITQDKWIAALESVRKPLGELKIRTVDSAVTETHLPATPDGKYVVMQFETAFASKNSTTETVTFSLEADGTWKACGYYIK